ncbi:MAG: zinc ribbon domain-containing protein [Nitrospirae bacterium]|nr:zinc ribbon domain-containing protein [Nitrospirota bacterium]
MPIYEYKCKDCGHAFEIIQKVDEAPKTVCNECNGELYKAISTSGLIFKGSGWYITDYSNKLKESKKEGPDSKAAETKKTEAPSTKAETVKSTN